jgi:hypothetical protein
VLAREYLVEDLGEPLPGLGDADHARIMTDFA